MQALFACFPALFILFSFLTVFHTGGKFYAGQNLVIQPVFQKFYLKLRRFSRKDPFYFIDIRLRPRNISKQDE